MKRPALLAAGGTIGMVGARARPDRESLDDLLRGLGAQHALGGVDVFSTAPSVHHTPAQALELAKRASELAGRWGGVVITHGTDLLEEVAFLADLVHEGPEPIVLTGAMRPASAPGADGPANVLDAIEVARSPAACDRGALLTMAGEIHSADRVRKVASTGVHAFASPGVGPVGVVREGPPSFFQPPRRHGTSLSPEHLDARVEVLQVGLGSDGAVLDAVAGVVDGLVLALPGAGHVPPWMLTSLAAVSRRLPVVAVARPAAGFIARGMYDYRGAERDVREAVTTCAGALGPTAARIKLMACLGAGLDLDAISRQFVGDDI